MLRNLHQLFVLCTDSQIIGGDFAKFCGLLRVYELQLHHMSPDIQGISWQIGQSNSSLVRIQILTFADILDPTF